MISLFAHIRLFLLTFTLWLSGCYGLSGPAVQIERPPDAPDTVISAVLSANPDFRLPSQVTLCGENFDLKKRFIYERLESEFLKIVNHPGQVALWSRRSAIFMPAIERELRAAGLPDDLKYLAVAESDLRPWIVSPAGALGIWQFMPATARHFGLTVTKKIDDRQLPEPSLSAAIEYFKSLHNKFGSWAVAMAAYNAGDGRLAKAVATQGTNNYFELDLPRETERYVYRIAAIKVVMDNAALYGLKRAVPLPYQPVNFSEKTVNFSGEDWLAAAKKAGVDYLTFRRLNPHLRQVPLTGATVVRLPG